MKIGSGIKLTSGLGLGGGIGGGAGQTLTTLPTTPQARYHPAFSTVTTSGGRVVTATDLMGLAGLTEGAAGIGPYAQTNLRGEKYWRFEGAEFLNIAASLVADNRACTVFMVGRLHRLITSAPIFNLGNVAQGSNLSNSNILDVANAASSAPFLRGGGQVGSNDATNGKNVVVGSQLQCMAVASRTTALGATTLWINGDKATVAQNSFARSAMTGGEIGRNPMATTVFGLFDLYELIVYTSALTIAQGDAIQAALMSNYAITPIVNQLVLEGDSITQGVGTITSGATTGMVLSEPGAGRIPANFRVVNMGVSGNQTSNLVTKRDTPNSWASILVAGQNVMAFQIGRNDMTSLTGAQHYTNVLAYLNTTTTGVLQRGWTVRVMANIAASGAIQTNTVAYRALIKDPQFKTDTLTNTGQTYDGKLSIINTDLIEFGGATIFEDTADAANTTYYQGDATHPTIVGTEKMITGGTTTAYAVAFGLVA